jgi:hypothetical protein
MHDFQEKATDVSLSMIALYDDDASMYNAGRKLEKLLDRLEYQSRSWRGGFNLWQEGRIQLDRARIKGDLEKTIGLLQDINKTMVAGTHGSEEAQRAAQVSQLAHDAVRLFTQAVSHLK